MKKKQELYVKKLLSPTPEADEVAKVLDGEGIEFHRIDQVNWTKYPYRPEVNFRIAQTNDSILLNYRVKEQEIRAKYTQDNGSVWTDSCVEFFVIPDNDGVYYNIEANCIGTLLMGAGRERNGRERASTDVTGKIKRWSSLGNKAIEKTTGEIGWELSLVIPYSAFYKHRINSLEGKTITGNFYKCGDELNEPHFISWNRIDTETPNFHLPDFFGKLIF